MVCSYEIIIDVKNKDCFLNDLYQVVNAYVIFYSMLSINVDKITISIDDEDLTYLALRHKLQSCKVDDAMGIFEAFYELHFTPPTAALPVQ